jgi:hypothetical protein
MEPRTGRIVQVQGSSPFPYSYYVILPSVKIFLSWTAPDPGDLHDRLYLVNGRVSPCLLTQTLSYLGQPVAIASSRMTDVLNIPILLSENNLDGKFLNIVYPEVLTFLS